MTKLCFLHLFLFFFYRIYELGARKFVISRIGLIGCTPSNVIRTPYSQHCNDDMNQEVKPYSDKLPTKLQELQNMLSHSLFINVDTYNFFQKIRNSPDNFGIPLISRKRKKENSMNYCLCFTLIITTVF